MARSTRGKEGSTKAASTLKRKSNVAPIFNPSGKLATQYTNWVVSAGTAADNWDAHYITKWQGIDSSHLPKQAAYINPMKKEWKSKGEEAFSEPSSIKAFFPRRDPSKMEGQFTIPAQEGTSFPWDLIITYRSSDSDTADFMGRRIAKLFTKWGAQHPEYYRVAPKFEFQKDVTSSPPKPLNHYICDSQCLMLLKQTYAEENSKDDVMADDTVLANCKFVVCIVCYSMG